MAITVERLEAQANADVSRAVADLGRLETALDLTARNRTATINVDVDQGMARVRAAFDDIDGRSNMVARAFDTVGSAAGEAASVLPTLASAVDGVGGATNNTTTVINNFGGGISRLLFTLPSLAVGLGVVSVALTAVYTAGTLLVGAVQTLTAAVGGLYAALAPLVGLLGAIPVGLGAIGGGVATLIMGFGGISKAVSAMDSAQQGATRSTYSAAAAARDLKSARQGIIDANKAVVRAEEELKRAVEGVTEARKEAARDLVEGRRSLRNALWAEEDAVDRLRRAQENLSRVQKSVGKSGAILSKETDDFTGKIYEVARVSADAVDGYDAQKQAQRELIRAQEDLERATARRKDQQEDLQEMEAKGIAGSDKVRDALRRREDAEVSLERAHDNVAAATERLARVQEEQARRAAGGAAANNALAAAMDKLTPIGQRFARFLHDEFLPAFEDVKRAAQDGLLPGVEDGLRSLMTLFPTMADEARMFGQGMGDAFRDIMKHFSTEKAIEDFKELGTLFREVLFGDEKNKTKGFMDALVPLGDILIGITKAAGPMTKMLTTDIVNGLEGISRWFDDPKNAKSAEGFFTGAYEMAKMWWRVFKPLGGILRTVAEAARPLAEWMLESLGTWLSDINRDLKTPGGFKALRDWFTDMKPAIREVTGFIGDFFKALFKPEDQGSEDSPITKFFKAMRRDWIPAFERLLDMLSSDTSSGEAFAGFLTAVTDAITALVSDPEAITNFIDDLSNLVEGFSDLMTKVEEVTNSSVWDLLQGVYDSSQLGMINMWVNMKRENKEGINEWEAYTLPRIRAVNKGIALALNAIPVIGPILSAVYKYVSKVWENILGIFTSGDIARAIGKKFESVGVNLRRGFAKALNPLIDAYNKIAGVLGLPKAPYIDHYANSHTPATGNPMTGGGKDPGSGQYRSYTTKSYTTGQKPGMRSFGGSVKGGESYIVGEKRAELLTLPQGVNGKIAAAVPRPVMESTGDGITEEQLTRILEKVLEKAKPNVDLKVEQNEHADPTRISHEIAWALA